MRLRDGWGTPGCWKDQGWGARRLRSFRTVQQRHVLDVTSLTASAFGILAAFLKQSGPVAENTGQRYLDSCAGNGEWLCSVNRQPQGF